MKLDKDIVVAGLSATIHSYNKAIEEGDPVRILHQKYFTEGYLIATCAIIDFPYESYEAMTKQNISVKDKLDLVLVYAKSQLEND